MRTHQRQNQYMDGYMKKQCNQQLPYRILSALERGPMTASSLADVVHRCPTRVLEVLNSLVGQALIHHAGYANTGKRGSKPKTWALGRGEGVKPKKIKPLTTAKRLANWRGRGNDSHLAKKIRKQMETMPAKMTMAGLLGA